MAKSISDTSKRKRGRPRLYEQADADKVGAPQIGLRLPPDELAAIDAWIDKRDEPKPTRPRAIRQLVEIGLTAKPNARPRAGEQQKDRAREMAGKAIDRMSDTTAPADAQAGRKRRLLKGPEEFRDSRVDRKTKK